MSHADRIVDAIKNPSHAPDGVWFSTVQCKGVPDHTTRSVKAAAGYARNYGGKVVRFVVDVHGHRVTDTPREPREAVAVWGVAEQVDA